MCKALYTHSKNKMIERFDIKQATKDLERYYPYINKCSICKTRYGVDEEVEDNGKCPICNAKVRRNNFKKAKSLKSSSEIVNHGK